MTALPESVLAEGERLLASGIDSESQGSIRWVWRNIDKLIAAARDSLNVVRVARGEVTEDGLADVKCGEAVDCALSLRREVDRLRECQRDAYEAVDAARAEAAALRAQLAMLTEATERFRHASYKRFNPAPFMDGERWPPSMRSEVEALDAAIAAAKEAT